MASSVIEARVTPPDLDNPEKYVKIPNVPILDPHSRDRVIRVLNPKTGLIEETSEETYVDEEQLQVITDNTNERSESGNYPLLLIGHSAKDKPETEQPPLVGYAKDLKVGKFHDDPVILADFYVEKTIEYDKEGYTYEKTYDQVLKQYPRRSIEVYFKTEPHGFIDAVALLRRTPFRPLGLVTYDATYNGREIYECECDHEKGKEMADMNGNGMNGNDSSPGQNGNGDSGGGNMEAEVAIERLATALVTKLASHEGFHKIHASMVSKQILPELKQHIESLLEEHASEEEPADSGGDEDEDENSGSRTMKPAGESEDEPTGEDEETPQTPRAEEKEDIDKKKKLISEDEDMTKYESEEEIDLGTKEKDVDEDEEEEKKSKSLKAKKKLIKSDESATDDEEVRQKRQEISEDEQQDMATSVGMPSATNTRIPAPASEPETMAEKKSREDLTVKVGFQQVVIDRLEKQNKALAKQVEDLVEYQQEQMSLSKQNSRRDRLQKLVDNGYELDIKEEMETYGSLEDPVFDAHVASIPRAYKRSIVTNGKALVRTAVIDDVTGESHVPELMADEYEAIEMYKQEHDDKCKQRPKEGNTDYGMRVVAQYQKLPTEERRKYQEAARAKKRPLISQFQP